MGEYSAKMTPVKKILTILSVPSCVAVMTLMQTTTDRTSPHAGSEQAEAAADRFPPRGPSAHPRQGTHTTRPSTSLRTHDQRLISAPAEESIEPIANVPMACRRDAPATCSDAAALATPEASVATFDELSLANQQAALHRAEAVLREHLSNEGLDELWQESAASSNDVAVDLAAQATNPRRRPQ